MVTQAFFIEWYKDSTVFLLSKRVLRRQVQKFREW
jgi:hypothetical protein